MELRMSSMRANARVRASVIRASAVTTSAESAAMASSLKDSISLVARATSLSKAAFDFSAAANIRLSACLALAMIASLLRGEFFSLSSFSRACPAFSSIFWAISLAMSCVSMIESDAFFESDSPPIRTGHGLFSQRLAPHDLSVFE